MSPEELTGRLSNQYVFCKHNSKKRLPGLCKECKDKKPYTVFLLCKGDKCDCESENGCGYFFGPDAKEVQVGKRVG